MAQAGSCVLSTGTIGTTDTTQLTPPCAVVELGIHKRCEGTTEWVVRIPIVFRLKYETSVAVPVESTYRTPYPAWIDMYVPGLLMI